MLLLPNANAKPVGSVACERLSKLSHDLEVKCVRAREEMAAADGRYGGYDYAFVDEDVPHKYRCTICTFVARDPQQATCCSHIFCNSCLMEYRKKMGIEFKCPTCRSLLTGKYFPDGRIRCEIKDLEVYCPNTCGWKGTVRDIEGEGHLSTCPYQIIDCSNGCGEKIRRMEMEAHASQHCPKRIISCPHCEEIGTHDVISTSNHLDKCPLLPVKCSNDDCEVICPHNTLSVHEGNCPKGIITCEYSSVGCVKRMKREEQEEHNDQSVKQHLHFAVCRINTLQQNPLVSVSQVIKFSDFYTRKRKTNNPRSYVPGWNSTSFYTSPGGYKMTLNVFVNGHNGEGSHVSCYTQLLEGHYDNMLEWPFQGEVTLELLNQLEDKNHKSCTLKYDESTPVECKRRVLDGSKSKRFGHNKFISHSELGHNPITNCCYLKDDCLYFRVTVHASSKTKPWLVGALKQ